MLCPVCQIEKLDKDFLNDSPICYKCVYQLKITKKDSKKKEERLCRECEKPVSYPRRVFCSIECAELDKAKNNNSHWTHNMKFLRVGFKADERFRRTA